MRKLGLRGAKILDGSHMVRKLQRLKPSYICQSVLFRFQLNIWIRHYERGSSQISSDYAPELWLGGLPLLEIFWRGDAQGASGQHKGA